MCSMETSLHEDFKTTIMNKTHNRNTLSDNNTFRHRHRRFWTEDDQIFGRIQRSKLKCCGDKSNLTSTGPDIKRTMSSNYEINSNSLMSRKNVQLVIVTVGLIVTLMITSASAFNVDVNSKVVHTAPRSTCDSECMFGFSVAQHKEKGQSW